MGTYVNGIYNPAIDESGWGDELNDLLAKLGETYINPMLAPYGAVGNGSTDDNTALHNALTAATGGTLTLPPRVFSYSSTLVLPDSTKIVGSGARTVGASSGGTVLKYTGSGAAIQASNTEQSSVSDLQINCTNNTSTVIGIEFLDPVVLSLWQNIVLKGPSTSNGAAIKFSGQSSCTCHNHFDTFEISTWKEGIVMSGFANANQFDNGAILGIGSGYAIDLDKRGTDTLGGADNLFNRIEIDGSTTNGIHIDNSASGNVFVKCAEDGVTTVGVLIGSNGTCTHNNFIACNISPTYTDNQTNQKNLLIGCRGSGIPSTSEGIMIGNAGIYWSSTDQLKTDDSFMVGGEVQIGPYVGGLHGSQGLGVFGNSEFSGNLALGAALDHNGTTVGFFGTNPTTKPTVTGSRGSNAALQSLLTALAGLGLIVDSSS